jgi:hypothetical protein
MKKIFACFFIYLAMPLFAIPVQADDAINNVPMQQAASAPSASPVSSFWGRIKSTLSPDKQTSVSNNTETEKDKTDASKSPNAGSGVLDSIKGMFSSGVGSKEDAVKVIDIQQVSSLSDVVVDPECKMLVQPFGIADNLLSLTVLTGKLKLYNELGSLGVPGATKQNSIYAVVKQAAISLNWLPMSAEDALGKELLDSKKDMILPENKNRSSRLAYQNARQTLQDVLAQIHETIPYDFQIYVIKESTGNAQALPGGLILVDYDIVSGKYDKQFAYFKIAHEVSHVLQRHQTRMYQARLADGMDSIKKFSNLINAANGSPIAFVPYMSGLKDLFINFTENQELQADSCAFRLMQANTQDTHQLINEIHDIEKKLGPAITQTAQSEKPKNTLETVKELTNGEFEKHPNTTQREQNLETLLSQAEAKPVVVHQ